MELIVGAKKIGGIWHGYIKGRAVDDESALRALSEEIAIAKAERLARKIAERDGALTSLRIVRETKR